MERTVQMVRRLTSIYETYPNRKIRLERGLKTFFRLKRQVSDIVDESMYYLTGYDTFGYCFFQCLYLDSSGEYSLFIYSCRLRSLPQFRISVSILEFVHNHHQFMSNTDLFVISSSWKTTLTYYLEYWYVDTRLSVQIARWV